MKVIKKTLSSMSGISGLLAIAVFVLTLVAPVRAQEREYTQLLLRGLGPAPLSGSMLEAMSWGHSSIRVLSSTASY
jgi:hypothetical protein